MESTASKLKRHCECIHGMATFMSVNDLQLISIVSPKALNHIESRPRFQWFCVLCYCFQTLCGLLNLLVAWKLDGWGGQMLWKISICWFSGFQNGMMAVGRCCACRKILCSFPQSKHLHTSNEDKMLDTLSFYVHTLWLRLQKLGPKIQQYVTKNGNFQRSFGNPSWRQAHPVISGKQPWL